MKTFYVLAALFLTVTGCTKKDTERDQKVPSELILNGEVTFSDNDPETASSVSAVKQVETRAGGQLPASTSLGVYIRNTPETAGAGDLNAAEWKNLPFVCNSSGQIVLSGGTGGVILTSGIQYDILAYSPQVQTVSDAHRIPVDHGTDILWGKKTVKAVPGATRVNLEFRHAGAQVGFKLKAKDGTTMDLSNAQMTVTGFYKTGTLDLETGKITGADPTEKLTDKTGAKSYVLATGDKMTVNATVTGVPDQPTFTGSYTLTLKPGKSYLYTITLNPNGEAPVKFDPEVVDWEDVAAGNDVIIK